MAIYVQLRKFRESTSLKTESDGEAVRCNRVGPIPCATHQRRQRTKTLSGFEVSHDSTSCKSPASYDGAVPCRTVNGRRAWRLASLYSMR